MNELNGGGVDAVTTFVPGLDTGTTMIQALASPTQHSVHCSTDRLIALWDIAEKTT